MTTLVVVLIVLAFIAAVLALAGPGAGWERDQ